MCHDCNDPHHDRKASPPARRKFLLSGATGLAAVGMAAVPFAARGATRAQNENPAAPTSLDYCAARNIKADIELIRPNQINAAMDAIVAKRARYRFAVDMTSGRRPA